MNCNFQASVLQLLKPVRLEPVLQASEKPVHHNEDPVQPKINKLINKQMARKPSEAERETQVRFSLLRRSLLTP